MIVRGKGREWGGKGWSKGKEGGRRGKGKGSGGQM